VKFYTKVIYICLLTCLALGVYFYLQLKEIKEFTFSYYSPAKQTVDLYEGPSPFGYKFSGEPLPESIVITSDFGRSLLYLDSSGNQIDKKYIKRLGKSVHLYGEDILIASRKKIKNYSLNTLALGEEKFKIQNKEDRLAFISGTEEEIIIGYSKKESHVEVYTKTDNEYILVYKDKETASYPRHAILIGSRLIVADTFNHRVYGVDILTSQKLFEFNSYYPNQLSVVDANTFVVVEEHMNRVMSYNISSQQTKVLFSCPVELYNKNKLVDLKNIKTMESNLIFSPNKDFPKSICSQEFSGLNTLYSPNGVRYYNGDLLIADTDNHRVVYIKNGKVVTEIKGMNNPVDALLIK